jgi:FtsP/CotA-like multicopper oxidase with cupredoxin domain
MSSRRRFLQSGALSGAALISNVVPVFAASTAAPLSAHKLSQFRDAMPRPRRMSGSRFDIPVSEFKQKLHSQLPPTRLWGYAAAFPGPTIEAVCGATTRITWRNELREQGLLDLLPVDQTLHWADPLDARAGHPEAHRDQANRHAPTRVPRSLRRRYRGPVPLVTHLHGAATDPVSDGHPEAWFTPKFEQKGPAWAREWSEYPNRQPGATLWYHDHSLGITRLTTYAGLTGFYLLRDPELERSLDLPSGDFEREIVIQDRSFDVMGQLRYAQRGSDPAAHPFWVPEFFGDTIVVNGRVWPYLEVEPRRYRLRLLNGSGSRFYRLSLSDGRPFVQIGSDGGFLAAPAHTGSLVLAPGERADAIVDFSGMAVGAAIVMRNDAPTPFPGGDRPDPRTTGRIMQFRIVALTGKDASRVPMRLADIAALRAPSVTRTLTLDEHAGHKGPHMSLLDGKRWIDPVSETPRLGETEVWEFANLTDDAHPIHLHLVQFQVLERQAFRARDYAKLQRAERGPLSAFLAGPAKPPDPNESGWKDTVRANPGEVTRIVARFAPGDGGEYSFDATAKPGYVWHCHILEHEDNEMMRPYEVRR